MDESIVGAIEYVLNRVELRLDDNYNCQQWNDWIKVTNTWCHNWPRRVNRYAHYHGNYGVLVQFKGGEVTLTVIHQS